MFIIQAVYRASADEEQDEGVDTNDGRDNNDKGESKRTAKRALNFCVNDFIKKTKYNE
jgi:hypothetical protein